MKEISIRELHRRTGAWVRSARKYGSILVRDRGRPIARITPASEEPEVNRYFDCTEAAEFLYACVRRTVEQDLPREIDYLRRHDEAIRRIMEAVEMPDRVAESLMTFIRQNEGSLSQGRREDEFKQLRDEEVTLLEGIVRGAFEGFEEGAGGGKT